MLTLVAGSFMRIAGLFTALLGLLASLQLVLIASAATFAEARSFERLTQALPTFIQNGFGPGLMSFDGMAMIGYFHPLAVMLVVQFAVYVGTEPAGEVEHGLVDLVLARPLPRHWLISRSLVLMTAGIVALILAMGFGTWLGLWTLAPRGARWPGVRVGLTMTTHLAMVAWCFGAAALAVGAYARRRGSAQASVALASVALYLIDFIGESWAPAHPLARLSPFHYYHGAAILRGAANSAIDLSFLGALAAAGIALAYWRFGRRDL